jgi:hypothetical protein
MTPSQLTAALDPDGWSPRQVLDHVRAADAIIAPRAYHVLVRDRPPLPSFDERAWAALIAAAEIPLDAQLAAFAIQRAELCAMLRSLPEESWGRAGMHEKRGEQSLEAMMTDLAEHEEEHLGQLRGMADG